MSLQVRREIIEALVVMTEQEQLRMRALAREIMAERENAAKDVRQCR